MLGVPVARKAMEPVVKAVTAVLAATAGRVVTAVAEPAGIQFPFFAVEPALHGRLMPACF